MEFLSRLWSEPELKARHNLIHADTQYYTLGFPVAQAVRIYLSMQETQDMRI